MAITFNLNTTPRADNMISRYFGDTAPVDITLTKDGTAVDLTGSTVKMVINSEPATEITATLTEAAAGKAEFDMSTVAVLPSTKYWYKITVDDGSYITTYGKAQLEII